MLYLDLDNREWLDKSIAQAIQKDILNKRPLTSKNLTETIKTTLPALNTVRKVNSRLKNFALKVKNSSIEI